MPSAEAKLLAMLALAAYVASTAATLCAARSGNQAKRLIGTTLLVVGISLSLASIVLRVARGYLPTASGFDTFSVLALLCGAAAAYFRAVDALPRLATIVSAVAAGWLALGVALGEAAYHDFARDVWAVAHIASAASATVGFAVAALGGWLYLRKHKQLRSKDPEMFRHPLPSLERLDRFIRQALPVAFALVTVTIVTGLVGALGARHPGYFRNWVTHPKVLTAGITWAVYAIALFAAHARRFRGRTSALLAIVGFALLAAVLIASSMLPRM